MQTYDYFYLMDTGNIPHERSQEIATAHFPLFEGGLRGMASLTIWSLGSLKKVLHAFIKIIGSLTSLTIELLIFELIFSLQHGNKRGQYQHTCNPAFRWIAIAIFSASFSGNDG